MDSMLFETERARLTAIATRILESTVDADDVVQQASLRFSQASDVADPPAWLTTVVTRLCLDQLRKRKTREHAETAAMRVPEVLDPEDEVVLAERIGDAMQVVLDTLTSTERAAFVLHDVFGYSHNEIGPILGRSETAVRQLASRARRKVHGDTEPVSEREARASSRVVVDAFLSAARGGDVTTLLALLAPDVTMRADLVGQRMGTDALYNGADAVAARFNGAKGAFPVEIDEQLGAAWIAAGDIKVAFVFHVASGRIREVELLADPEVIATLNVVRIRNARGTDPE